MHRNNSDSIGTVKIIKRASCKRLDLTPETVPNLRVPLGVFLDAATTDLRQLGDALLRRLVRWTSSRFGPAGDRIYLFPATLSS
ncbi:MAG: hypothetical protein K0A93_02405 [Desulfuromonadaceae bacterium]|nr:hypothetical protein [Desulfuromonadaceae bacterium]